MKRLIHVILFAVATILTCHLTVSCEKWTRVETVGTEMLKPWEKNPKLWNRYFENLRDYKSRVHYIALVRFENGAEVQVSEKNRMRSLPDSLDMVILTNPDHFSESDREDMKWMKDVGTKVLFRVDLAGRADAFSDPTVLNAYLEKAVSSVRDNGLDGWSFTGIFRLDDSANAEMAASVMNKLTAAKTEGQVIVFEGNPRFVPEALRPSVNFFVLDTERTETSQELLFQVLEATDYAGIPEDKLLLGADYENTVLDESKNEYPAVEEITRRVFSYGPLGGIGITNIGGDYYHFDGNYTAIRSSIRVMNP